ncbi:hypothetical protein [Pseudomonas viridiflava]|uniref:hypothetical protein n=1 Tax=Pseudomonas viridiflava TaxID=33069 RepID=UPI001BCE8722|nr:hypothetical protein [Pseudomonas viridiflava]MEE4224818.1 hypothetical protein [Pseudomonas viridiflava]QVI88024.1 hypothetical protein KHW14_12020 [Pseudomonas viridiflava]
MTDGQHALILKCQATTPSSYHHIINHLVLTDQLYAVRMLVSTLEQEQAKNVVCSEAARKVAYDRKLIVDQLESLSRQADKLEREAFMSDMQAEGFRIRVEQLLEENAKLKVV